MGWLRLREIGQSGPLSDPKVATDPSLLQYGAGPLVLVGFLWPADFT